MDNRRPASLRLPAQDAIFSDAKRPDYQFTPSNSHIKAAGEALAEVASAVSVEGGDEPQEIFLHHVINSYCNFLLFATYFVNIGGSEADDTEADGTSPIHVGIIANHSVDMQVQASLDFLQQILARRDAIQHFRDDSSADMADLQRTTSATDLVATERTIDDLRHGWRQAAAQLHRRAQDLGLALTIVYQPSYTDSHRQWRGRLPALRRTYNEFADFRSLIDQTVTYMAARDHRVAGGPEELRRQLQQWGALSSQSQYLAHAYRDGLVLGNGLLAFTRREPFSFYALRPEAWRPVGHSVAEHVVTGERLGEVIHFTGFDQIKPGLGLGLGELMLPYQEQIDTMQRAIRDMEAFSNIPEAVGVARGYRVLLANMEERRSESIKELIGWWPKPSGPSPTHLYLPGQELMA